MKYSRKSAYRRHSVLMAATAGAAAALLVGILMLPFNSRASQNPASLATTGVFSGLTEQNAINNALDALLTCNSGSAAPVNALGGAPKEGQCWLDTTSATLKIKKRYSGSGWVVEGVIDVTNGVWIPAAGGGTGAVASAATVDLCASPQQMQTVSGAVTITSFGSSCPIGTRRTLIFSGAAALTYDAAAMILPGQVSYTTAANDVIEAVYLGSAHWRVTAINRINGQAVINPAVEVGVALNYFGGAVPAKYLLGYGQALTRTSYPDYLAAVTRTQTGTSTAGNATITGVGDTSGMGAGMPLEGTCYPAGTTVSSVTGSAIVASANAITNGACNVTVFFTGYGSGGSASTVGVPDCRDAVIAGRGDMGGTDRGLLTASVNGFGGNAKALNVFGGGESVTLSATQIPSITSSQVGLGISVSSTVSDVLQGTDAGIFNSGGASSGHTVTPPTSSGITSTGSVNVNVTSNNTGGGAHRTVQPTLTANCIVRVLAMIDLPANDNAPIARGREPFAIARRFA
jgi:hypothetical protein